MIDTGQTKSMERRQRFIIWCAFGEMFKFLFCILLCFFGSTLGLLIGPALGLMVGTIIGVGGGLLMIILAVVLCIILFFLFLFSSAVPIVGETVGYLVLIPLLLVPILICLLSSIFFSLPIIGPVVGLLFGPFATIVGILGLFFPNPALIMLCPFGNDRVEQEHVTYEYVVNVVQSDGSVKRQQISKEQHEEMMKNNQKPVTTRIVRKEVIVHEEASNSTTNPVFEQQPYIIPPDERQENIKMSQRKDSEEKGTINYVSHLRNDESENLTDEEIDEGRGDSILLGNLAVEEIPDVVYNDQLVYDEDPTLHYVLGENASSEIVGDEQSPDTSSKTD